MQHQHLKMLTAKDVCDLFGFSDTTLWRSTKRGDFPEGIQVGGRKMWHVNTLEKWLIERGVDPAMLGVEPPPQPKKKRQREELC